MSQQKNTDSLEKNENLDYHKKEWIWVRWGWILMLVTAAAAILGLFGQGPLSNATASAGGIVVQYDRFERLFAPSQMKILLTQSDFPNGEARLQFDRGLLEMYTVQVIIPDPGDTELSAGHITYQFKVSQAGQPLQISFDLTPKRLGLVRGKVGLENGESVQIDKLIYP